MSKILDDIQNCVKNGRTPVVLTRFKEQARYLYEQSKNYVFVFYGNNTNKENKRIRKQMKEVLNDRTLILIATGSKIGEGFDFPRNDEKHYAVIDELLVWHGGMVNLTNKNLWGEAYE